MVLSHKTATGLPYGIVDEIGGRSRMEDQFAVYHFPEQEFFSAEIYDGHGGTRAALYASEMLTPAFMHLWSREQAKPVLERREEAELLREAFHQVDRYIVSQVDQIGTTAAIFYLIGNRFLAANAGDSRVVIGISGGAAVLTVDHRPYIGSEQERIEGLGGSIITVGVPRVQGVLAVTRSLGDAFLKPYVTAEPRVAEGNLGRENDWAVLACDGVWDVMEPHTAMMLVRQAGLPQEGAQAVLDEALNRGSTDNITVLVIDLRPLTATLRASAMDMGRVTDFALADIDRPNPGSPMP
jgi:protein phosphatase 1L